MESEVTIPQMFSPRQIHYHHSTQNLSFQVQLSPASHLERSLGLHGPLLCPEQLTIRM